MRQNNNSVVAVALVANILVRAIAFIDSCGNLHFLSTDNGSTITDHWSLSLSLSVCPDQDANRSADRAGVDHRVQYNDRVV